MAEVFKYHHANGVKPQDMFDVLDSMDFTDGMESLLRELPILGGESIIISDANSVFIQRILEVRKLKHVFSHVFTNPAFFDDQDLLNISPFMDNKDCSLCNQNMCKVVQMHSFVIIFQFDLTKDI
jgi:2,3-diketo-5-methylthio-1-phosphopentane phosphatase